MLKVWLVGLSLFAHARMVRVQSSLHSERGTNGRPLPVSGWLREGVQHAWN